MLRPLLPLLAVLLVAGNCATPPAPEHALPPAGSTSALSSDAAAAPAPPPEGHPASIDQPGGCTSDLQCPHGQVCERCGAEATCTPGCRQDSQCPAGEKCRRVQCIRCPCPGQCG